MAQPINIDEKMRLLWGEPRQGQLVKAILVGAYKRQDEKETVQEHLEELKLLADTQGIDVACTLALFLRAMTAATFLSTGKLEEVKQEVQKQGSQLVIFDDDISPAQQRNIEQYLQVPVIDRTEVILGVFAMRAKSREAKLQVELAEVKYLLPRLKRMWTHLSRQSGGGGGASGGGYLKGEGEKQIEIDRRILKRRVEQLEKEIDEIGAYRETQRSQRVRSGIPVIAIVGYTNAGKSTLMNTLTEAGVYVEDKLFATLDTTTRKYLLPNKQEVLFIDTVGFIRKLPHLLVAAFRSTLEEAVFADIILHVIDASQPVAETQAKTTLEVLKELNADLGSIITVFNKQDLVVEKTLFQMKLKFPGAVTISAFEKQGIDSLVQQIITMLQARRVKMHLRIPQTDYHLVALGLREGKVYRQEYEGNDVIVDVEIPATLKYRFTPYATH